MADVEEKIRWLKALGKFKKSELPAIAGQLGLDFSPKAKSKRELVSLFVDECFKAQLTYSDLLKVELSRKLARRLLGVWY